MLETPTVILLSLFDSYLLSLPGQSHGYKDNDSRRQETGAPPNRLRYGKTQISFSLADVFGTDDPVAMRRGYMTLSELNDYELAMLGLDTYGKEEWSPEDVGTLRECWDEFQRRGEDTMTFCRPSYSYVLIFHEVDSGEVGEDEVRSLERIGAGIAEDYRHVMRKLRLAYASKPPYHDAVCPPISRI